MPSRKERSVEKDNFDDERRNRPGDYVGVVGQLSGEDSFTRDIYDSHSLASSLAGEFGRGMDERYGKIIVENDLWGATLELALHADPQVAFRAAWALEWAYFNDPEPMDRYTDIFIANYLCAANGSVHRHYSKILCDILRRGEALLDDRLTERIAERAFDLLICEESKNAVRIWSAEILFELIPRLDWVVENLDSVLRHQAEISSAPALHSHYPKLLRRIGKRKM